ALIGIKPRLKPFHVTMKITLNGFDTTESYTCKDRSLEFLTNHEVMNPQIKEQILCSKATQAFPRFSGLELPPIRLISTGEPEKHVSKKSKVVHYNHVWNKNNLFWASAIQTLDQPEALDNASQRDGHYRLIKNMLHRIKHVEELLRHKITEIIETNNDEEYLTQLQHELNQVQQLSFLFSNSYENQNPQLLSTKLACADKIMNCATMTLNPERINYTFLLRAYESTAACNALLGVLAMLLSIGVMLVAPVVGIALLTTTTLSTARQLHGFYREEVSFAALKRDYHNEKGNAYDIKDIYQGVVVS
ncbi:MAG: hypothetical protein PSV35_08340, partial [bacterium]|nr:hypothetical protein [bacterium]